jgi:hypothetical protein
MNAEKFTRSAVKTEDTGGRMGLLIIPDVVEISSMSKIDTREHSQSA